MLKSALCFSTHGEEVDKVGVMWSPNVLMCMYPLCAFWGCCLKTPTCARQSVCLLCTAPLVSWTLYCITKQIAANQIRALSSTQTQGDEWKKCMCVSGGEGDGGSEVASRDPGWGWKDTHLCMSMDRCSFIDLTDFFAVQCISLAFVHLPEPFHCIQGLTDGWLCSSLSFTPPCKINALCCKAAQTI